MKPAFTILLSCFLLTTYSQKEFKKEITGKLSQKIFSKDAELKQWFGKEYQSYKPDENILRRLESHLAERKIIVVLGTWCSDSQREFPHLMKVLDKIHFPLNNLKIYGVNSNKSSPAKIIAKYKIINVPTIMLLNNDGIERGRITENVIVSFETDLLGF